MRRWIVGFVVVAGLGGSAAAEDEEKAFDLNGEELLTHEDVVTACATEEDAAACEATRTECAERTGFAHGTNMLVACVALGFSPIDQDLPVEHAAVIVKHCTDEPQGGVCLSILAMCVRNRDEGWPMPMIQGACNDATKAGATWETTEVDVPREYRSDDRLDISQISTVPNAEIRRSCESIADDTGGYILGSRLAEQCRGQGVIAPDRDLRPKELAAVHTFCVTDPQGRFCSSLGHLCSEYDVPEPPSGFPRVAEACAAYWIPHPPPRIVNSPSITGGWLAIAVGRVDAPEQLDDTDATIAMDLAMHSVNGRGPFGLVWAVHTTLGSTTGGGFLYDLGVGLGAGLRFGDEGLVTATIGGGLSGITGGRLGFAWTVPVELHAGIPLGGALRLTLGSRASWVFKENPRQEGSTSVSMFDEVEARAGLAFRRGPRSIWGVYAFASELRETRILGVALSLSAMVRESGEPRRYQ